MAGLDPGFLQQNSKVESEPIAIKNRLIKLENQLRELISRNYNSVRRAWLALDFNHDG